MTIGKMSNKLNRRIQFLNNESMSSGDSFEFAVQNEQATVFASAAFKVEILMADVKFEDAQAGDWQAVSTDGTTYDFDGSATTVRVLSGPGHYRLVANATASNVYAGVIYPAG